MNKLFFVSMVLSGELVSFFTCNPFGVVCSIAKFAKVENVTIKNA